MAPARQEQLDLLEYEALLPIYEAALKADPEDLIALYWLGHAYTRLRRYEDGLEMDLRFTRLRPEDGVARYNLCCSYALLNRTDEALEALEAAIRLGYRDVEQFRDDEDLANLRGDPRFLEILARLEAS